MLDAVRTGTISAVASWELAEEIVDVMRRPKVRRYDIGEDDVRELLILLAPLLPSVEVVVEVRDPDDAPVIRSAIAGRADAIVTGDQDLVDDPSLRDWLLRKGIEVLTPAALLERIGSSG